MPQDIPIINGHPVPAVQPVGLQRTRARHVTTTLSLPAHTVIGQYGSHPYGAASVTVTCSDDDLSATQHAINLLETLFAHGVTSTEQLAYVLTITGNPRKA